MKFSYYILLFLVLATYANGQQSKTLRHADFKEQKLNEEWIYVKFKSDQASAKHQAKTKKLFSINTKTKKQHVFKMKVPAGMDPVDYCNQLRQTSEDIEYADPIVMYVPLSTPSDALISNQFYLDNIKAFDAWDITKGDDDITIGIIDSGIDLDHEDIVNNLWLNTDDPVDGIDNDNNGYVDDYTGYDFADDDTDPSIQNGNHGMIVAGIAGASTNNGTGIAGLGYNTKVAALKGFKSSNGSSNGLYDAIIYAAENGFDVANLSWGRMGIPLQSEQDIINYAAIDHDMILVAAAGNEGGKSTEENKWYPASYDHVLSVGATDAADNKSSGSTFNRTVDLVAPGVSMYSTVNNNGYSNGGPGTSFASPLVAAAAALVKDQFPTLSAIQIMERVRSTADDIYDLGSNSVYEGKLGKGRLNVLRAVSESNVKSLRAENPQLTSSFGGNVFFGDTVMINATLTNHLASVNSPLITISSPNNDFTVSTGSFQPGFMSTGDTREIAFEVVLDDDVAPNTDIEIRLDYSETGYSDFQFLEVTTSPDFVNFGNDRVSMTISGNGSMGYDSYDPFEGSGFLYQLDTLMDYTGLILATSSSSVSDNIISDYTNQTRNQDFQVEQNYKLFHHPHADHFGYSEFNDNNRAIRVEQSNIAYENEDYIILRYRIVNTSAAAITNLSFGIFADWDLGTKTENYATYDLTGDYAFAKAVDDSRFAGVAINGGDSFEYSMLDMAALNGNFQDINNTITDTDKYDFLVNQALTTAGEFGGNDVATLNGITINQLDAYGDAYIDVIMAVSDSKANLETIFASATNKLDEFLLHPRVLETISVCTGTSLTIDPSEGDMFEFYEDPLAQDLLTTATSYSPGVITKDTAFYIKNIDNSYSSDVFEIRVKLFDEIADFEMSTDTLYLDHPTTNAVQFTDLSLDAITWNWDFDQGTSSSIQNPSLSFSQTGTYSISLEISNALGCVDSIIKNLVVANRPTTPTLSNATICPGEDVTLNDPSAEKLFAYAFEDSDQPSLSGSSILLQSISHDTIVYISGVFGSFESDKVPVEIDVLEVTGTISHFPDTTSSTHQIVLKAEGIDTESTLSWEVNGSAVGTTDQISVAAEEGLINARLEILSTDGCTKTIDKEILVSTSPFASQEDLISCFNEEIIIRPANGTYFGFYEDAELTSLIKKGTELKTNSHSQIYVVNLDDGLPGMPIEVNVTNQVLSYTIAHVTSEIGEKIKVDLSIETTDQLSAYTWYINNELASINENPTFFLDQAPYEIVLAVTGASGCTSSDTLQLDFSPPLSISEDLLHVYPNPTSGIIQIDSKSQIEVITLHSLDGKEVLRMLKPTTSVDLSTVPKGLYILKVVSIKESFEQKLLIE